MSGDQGPVAGPVPVSVWPVAPNLPRTRVTCFVDIGQQAGGAIGLAVIGAVAWSAVASSRRSQAAAAARAGVPASGARAAALQTQIYHHALAAGFSRGYLVSAGIMALILIIALAVLRVSRQDLAGADPAPAGDTSSPNPA